MSSDQKSIEERAQRIREEEGTSHGRDPENMDPVMLEGEDANTVAANKAISHGGEDESTEAQGPTPGMRMPPD